ncbi:MAG: NADH-quinone oxidoreductase subunit NuoH [Planctomycetes bacterium]|nr:NADH-quinone oxidoreductase subunit NuoH [Planctomycetota bacterium]
MAVGLYRIGSPIVRRFPGTLFILASTAAILATGAIGYGMYTIYRLSEMSLPMGPDAKPATVVEIQERLSQLGLPVPATVVWCFQSSLVRDVVALLGIIAFVSVLAMFAIWWERKVSAHIQSRLGPMRVGGWHGWSQSLADGLKLIGKEDLIPTEADRPLYRLAPYLAFVPALAAFIFLPFGAYWVMRDLDVALIILLAVLAIEVIGVLVGGWASNNKWSVYGALREACQVVSYEIPMGISLLVPVMIAGSLRLSDIAGSQQGGWFHWLAWHSPWAFLAMFLYFIASLAACKRAPFDLPEAESELVAGFHTEYSGFRWSLFFFAEYAAMFLVSGLLVILFLGGWDAPWAGLDDWLGRALGWHWLISLSQSQNPYDRLFHGVFFSGPLWFIGKAMVLVYVQLWLRWTLPRLRIDQVLYSCVQVMLPLTIVVLVASAVWEMAVQEMPGFSVFASLISPVIAFIGILGCGSAAAAIITGTIGRRALVGTMAVERPLRGG